MPALCRRVRPPLLACWCALSSLALAVAAHGQTARGNEPGPSAGPLSIQVEPALPLSPDLLGRPVTRLEVVTAGGRWQAPEQLQKTPLGQPLSAAYVRAVLRELLSSGRYAEASAVALPYGSAALLRVTVLPRRIVTELRVSGSSLDSALVLEKAGVSPGDDITVQTLTAINERVRELYRTRGYPAAVINTEAIDTDEPLHVVLNIGVQPGEPLLVAERQLELHPRATPELSRLAADYAVDAGDRLDEEQLQRSDLELAKHLRSEGYHDAAVEHRTQWNGDGFRLVVAVWAGPRLRLRFLGNESFDADELEQELEGPEDAEHTA